MLPAALDAAVELIIEEEVFTEVVALGRLLPLDLDPVLESVARTGTLVTVEEGTLTGGLGAEIAARVQSEAWDCCAARFGASPRVDGILPAALSLERAVIPEVDDIVEAVLAGTRSRPSRSSSRARTRTASRRCSSSGTPPRARA